MKFRCTFFSILLLLSSTLHAQSGQALRGRVVDNASGEPLAFATVSVVNANPPVGAASDSEGYFVITGLNVGRYDLEASMVGYEPMSVREIVVSSAKEAFVQISLAENVVSMEEIVVVPKVNKQQPLNGVATASARMLSMEEASRYAGGYDDPARLVTSFAGVAGNVSSNAIAVRGNSPQFLQWRLEGVEIPNPTHFPDITGVGGGILTALSSQVLGNSDFFTGAFPAEYDNALSGVFDMQLRNGNPHKSEQTFQIGTLGIDLGAEGPFKKGGKSSYLLNYRYATMALADDLFPGLLGGAAGMRYQDLSFKLNFPTRRAGTFSLWGIGVIDRFHEPVEKDTTQWETRYESEALFRQTMGAAGLGHKIYLSGNTYIKTSLAATYSRYDLYADAYDRELAPTRINRMDGTNWDLSLSSYINTKFSARWSGRTGLSLSRLAYDLDYNVSPSFPEPDLPIENYALGNGSTYYASAFTHATGRLSRTLTANIGLTAQYFYLTERWNIEPRAGITWQAHPKHALALAYGAHSRREKLDYYFVEKEGKLVNRDFDMTKAHHLVLSYDWTLSPNAHLKIEPYYQYLYDVPVEATGSFSIINHSDWYLDRALVNRGEGRNYGVEVTAERYLADGYYWLLTGSLFESRYQDGEGVWRDTRLSRGYLVNVLGGKEWTLGARKRDIFGVNVRLSYQGGERYTPIDMEASLADEEAIYDESRAFQKQLEPVFLVDFTINYKLNRRRVAHEFSIKMVNMTGYQEYGGHFYNVHTRQVEMARFAVVVPSVSYKIDF